MERIGKSRLEALSDGIFAIAMTILVLSLTDTPVPQDLSSTPFHDLFVALYSPFLFFVIAFFILAGYWLAHHRIISSIEFASERLIWINILFLFFIVLIPFSTWVSGDYPDFLPTVLLFHLNLLVASLILTFMWYYIRRNFGKFSPGEERHSGEGLERAFTIHAVILLAIAVSFISPHASMWCYMLMPVSLIVQKRFRKSRSPDQKRPV